MSPNSKDVPEAFVIGSEFAEVSVSLDTHANSPRLKITDLATGRTVFLDALELSSLTSLTHSDFDRFIRPRK